MKDYKRLTTKKYGTYLASCENCGYNNPSFDCDTYNCKQVLIKRLAELEDKIENGTLLELPCKIGDTIYQIYKDCSNCPHFKENDWEYDCWCDFDGEESKTIFKFDGDKDCVYIIEETKFTYNHIKDFGKDLFLTKAEAEKKLEELKNENTCKQQDKN